MVAIYEQPGGSYTRDSRGKERDTRVFIINLPKHAVDTLNGGHSNEDQDGRDPIVTPGIGDTHPKYPGLTVVSATVERLSGFHSNKFATNQWSVLTVEYSNDRSLIPPPPPPFDAKRFSISFDLEEVPLPIMFSRRIIDPSGNESQILEATTQPAIETRARFSVRLNLGRLVSFEDIRAILDQNNKVHEIPDGQGGVRRYLFEAGDLSQRTEDSYEVTYSWFYDRGTDVPPVKSGDGWTIPDSDSETTNGLYRLPFHKIVYVDHDPVLGGRAVNVMRYAVEPNGWQTLPTDGSPLFE